MIYVQTHEYDAIDISVILLFKALYFGVNKLKNNLILIYNVPFLVNLAF